MLFFQTFYTSNFQMHCSSFIPILCVIITNYHFWPKFIPPFCVLLWYNSDTIPIPVPNFSPCLIYCKRFQMCQPVPSTSNSYCCQDTHLSLFCSHIIISFPWMKHSYPISKAHSPSVNNTLSVDVDIMHPV